MASVASAIGALGASVTQGLGQQEAQPRTVVAKCSYDKSLKEHDGARQFMTNIAQR
jgi:hypothetical protein